MPQSIEDIFRRIEEVPDFFGLKIDSVQFRNQYGDTPLHIVCCWDDIEAIEALVNAGADINAKGESGFTPLHCVVEQNHPEAILKLVELGASDLLDDAGKSALELARVLQNIEAATALEKKPVARRLG